MAKDISMNYLPIFDYIWWFIELMRTLLWKCLSPAIICWERRSFLIFNLSSGNWINLNFFMIRFLGWTKIKMLIYLDQLKNKSWECSTIWSHMLLPYLNLNLRSFQCWAYTQGKLAKINQFWHQPKNLLNRLIFWKSLMKLMKITI
jgi:hypothetical protein